MLMPRLNTPNLKLQTVVERIVPALKDKSVPFPLSKMRAAMDASKAASSVLTASSEGVN